MASSQDVFVIHCYVTNVLVIYGYVTENYILTKNTKDVYQRSGARSKHTRDQNTTAVSFVKASRKACVCLFKWLSEKVQLSVNCLGLLLQYCTGTPYKFLANSHEYIWGVWRGILNLKKAFDLVDYDILLKKLTIYLTNSCFPPCFKSNLDNRM